MNKIRGVIVYIGFGGIKTPAEAVKAELEKLGCEIVLVDIAKKLGSWFVDSLMEKGWRLSLKVPFLIECSNALSNNPYISKMMYLHTFRFKKKIMEYLNQEKFDFVLSTHFMVTDILSDLRKAGKIKTPVFGYNADIISSHAIWISKNVDLYFAPTKDAYEGMIKKGMSKDKMVECSFPINEKYINRIKGNVYKKVGLKKKFTVIFTIGGEGFDIRKYVAPIAKRYPAIQIVVICGRNKKIIEMMNKLSEKYSNIIVKGFVDNMHEYYRASDLAVIKAGFNTIFECIFMKKPFIIIKAMGNEVIAANYVRQNELGWWTKTQKGFLQLFNSIIKDKKQLYLAKKRIEKQNFEPGAPKIAKCIMEYVNKIKKEQPTDSA